MNPFDLTGPSFLVFYWTLSIFGLLFIYWLRLRSDTTGPPAQMSSDPCVLAYLRDGYAEVVRVALIALVDEGVVTVKDRELSLAPEATRPARSRRTALEKELLAFLGTRSATVDQIVDRDIGYAACIRHRMTLEEFGYLRRSADVVRNQLVLGVVAGVLVTVAVLKIVVAFSRGRTNVTFLILSAMAAVWLAIKIARPGVTITTRGRQALQGAEALLAGARQRLKDASAALRGQELAWLAAAFGFSVFNYTPTNFAFWPALAFASGERQRRPDQASGAGSGSSCGSVSSCGGGGGSSCGGGGGCGGGGCGGCGGE